MAACAESVRGAYAIDRVVQLLIITIFKGVNGR